MANLLARAHQVRGRHLRLLRGWLQVKLRRLDHFVVHGSLGQAELFPAAIIRLWLYELSLAQMRVLGRAEDLLGGASALAHTGAAQACGIADSDTAFELGFGGLVFGLQLPMLGGEL